VPTRAFAAPGASRFVRSHRAGGSLTVKLAIAAAAFLALVAIALAIADRLNDREFRADAAAAVAASGRQPEAPVSEADVAALPPPVAAHLRAAGVVGQRRVSVARFRHAGRFLASKELGWRSIAGEYVLTTATPAFLWYGRIRMAPLVPVVARDGFALGRGRMLVLPDPGARSATTGSSRRSAVAGWASSIAPTTSGSTATSR
jgi:hypothetical protein